MSCSSPDPPTFCSDASPELKLYQAFIFSVPVFFTFILLLFFYLFYLRRRRANWSSLRMRISYQDGEEMPRILQVGLKKEVREMLPVVVFKESFLIRETQCSVCLGDYKSDDRLKRIPPCGHTFHIDCIDNWLAKNITCPLCRASLIPTPKPTIELSSHERNDLEGQGIGREPIQAVYSAGEGETSGAAGYDNGVQVMERLCSCTRTDEQTHDTECRLVTHIETNEAV